jgi:hypothetical protein
MAPALYLLFLAVLARQLQSRVVLLEPFRGLPRYLLSFGLTLFLANWADFALYAALGWGFLKVWCSWLVVVIPIAVFAYLDRARAAQRAPAFSPAKAPASEGFSRWRDMRRWNGWLLFFMGFVLVRSYLSLTVDDEGLIWCNFSFFDTPFHLSVTNAFLQSSRFPPIDLDMPPYPLKYHFLADYHVAHLVRLGLPALKAVWLMNLISGFVMTGAVWAAFERWLGLPARWTMLACFVFLFLNPSLLNLIHHFVYHPPFYHPERPFYGLMAFQYFNFEAIMANALEPQRALLFTLPIIVLILQALFGPAEAMQDPAAVSSRRQRQVLWVFILICLLPFAHIVAFAVLTLAALPAVWRHRAWLLRHADVMVLAFTVGALQLLYLRLYGPPTNPAYSGWDVRNAMPLEDYAGAPAALRRVLFWFFANGDFLTWGLVFGGSALLLGLRRDAASGPGARLREFLRRWGWYFAVCLGCFALINVYRYSFDWGDSNKFVFFLNLGLVGVIMLGAAQWVGRRGRALSHVFWGFFLLLCVLPPTYNFYRRILATDHDMVLLFTGNDLAAADWLRTSTQPRDVVLTSTNEQIHFVSSLAGRPARLGIYSNSNPYRPNGMAALVRQVYEECDLSVLPQLKTRFVCISRTERHHYRLHPRWHQLMAKGTGVVFHSGGIDAEDDTSVFIFDSRVLSTLPSENLN